jgi:hypothetical protein
VGIALSNLLFKDVTYEQQQQMALPMNYWEHVGAKLGLNVTKHPPMHHPLKPNMDEPQLSSTYLINHPPTSPFYTGYTSG